MNKINQDKNAVRHVTLSDHTADRLNQKEFERLWLYEEALETYEKKCRNIEISQLNKLQAYKDAVQKRQQKIDLTNKKRKKAWKQRAWRKAVKYSFQYLSEFFSGKPAKPIKARRPRKPTKESFDEDDRIWQSGRDGEKQVEDFLLHQLNSDWTLFSGYKNRKGEIDKILVGSEGIFAIEVKNINGHIYCDGDKWWKDKYDNYGNLVEWDKPIHDKNERSPSRQLNESADMLQLFLRRTFPSCKIFRIVVFTHKSSKIQDITNPTVNEVINIQNWNLRDTFEKCAFKMTKVELMKAVHKIERDHQFMNKR